MLQACGIVYRELYTRAGDADVVEAELRELAADALAAIRPMESIPRPVVGCCFFILSHLEGYGLQPSKHIRNEDGTEEFVPPLHGPVAGTGPYHRVALYWRGVLDILFGAVSISG